MSSGAHSNQVDTSQPLTEVEVTMDTATGTAASSDSNMDTYIESSTHGVVVSNTQASPSYPDLNRRDQPGGDDDVEEDEEEEKLTFSKKVMTRERWIQHYSSSHKILLVGEGDFSFSASLAMAFVSATNMVATSLHSRAFSFRIYKNSKSNISKLRSRGCTVMHGIDATEMANHYLLKHMTFDRIIFNFPLAGFFRTESRRFQIRRNQTLIHLFLDNAKKMISEEGEIHITHKSWGIFRKWNLEHLAIIVGLGFIEELPFNFQNYRGYNTKYGFGGDNNFDCNPSIMTYIVGHKHQEQIRFELLFIARTILKLKIMWQEFVDLASLPKLPGMKISAKIMADRIQVMQDSAWKQFGEFLARRKKEATARDKWRQQVKRVFQEGDLVMVYLPVGLYNKFKKKKFGPYQVIKKLGVNDIVYVIDLLEQDIAISPTFHVEDLFSYDPSLDKSNYPEPNFRGTSFQGGEEVAFAYLETMDRHKSKGAPVSLKYTT